MLPENQRSPAEDDNEAVSSERRLAHHLPEEASRIPESPGYDMHYSGSDKARRDYDWTDDDIAAVSLSGCISTIVLSLAWLGYYLNGQGVTQSLIDGSSEKSAGVTIGLMAASVLALTSSAYFFAIKKHPQRWQSVGLRPSTRSWLIGSAVIGVLFVPVNILIVTTVQRMLDVPVLDFSAETTGESIPIPEFLAVFILVVIIVPIAEEIFFRGLIYKWLRRRAGFMVGILVSSITFGTLHFAAPSIAAITVLGVLCALVYELTDSIWNAVVIHAMNNLLAIMLAYLFWGTPTLL